MSEKIVKLQEQEKLRQNKLLEYYDTKTNWFEKADGETSSLDEHQKLIVAQLIENQKFADHQIQTVRLQEYTTSASAIPINTVVLPMVRKIYPNLIANQLVSVQPLALPTAKVFYMDVLYDTDVFPVLRGESNTDPKVIDRARYYTRGWVRGEPLGTGDGTRTEFAFVRRRTPYWETKFTPVRENDHLRVYVDGTERSVKFSGSVSGLEVRVYTQTGDIVFATAPGANAVVTADYDLRIEGDDSRIPEMALSFTSSTIDTFSRKIKARWTIEAEQDYAAFMNMNIEAELTKASVGEITREIDAEIMHDLWDAPQQNVNWSKAFPGTAAGYSGRKEYDETLLQAVNVADSMIYDKRGANADWMLVSRQVLNRFLSMNSWAFRGDNNGGVVGQQAYLAGQLQNRWRVFVDPSIDGEKILLGRKSQGNLFDSGYVYTPYLGLIATEVFGPDPDNWVKKKGWMRRDGTKLISSDDYVSVTVTA